MQSSSTGNEGIARILIDKGANINVIDKDGHTALDVANEINQSEGKFQISII